MKSTKLKITFIIVFNKKINKLFLIICNCRLCVDTAMKFLFVFEILLMRRNFHFKKINCNASLYFQTYFTFFLAVVLDFTFCFYSHFQV